MIWFTSDLHLSHNKEFIYKDRGFNSIEEHNKAIVHNWNAVVQEEDDIIYVLGDLIMTNIDDGMKYLKQLKGDIRFLKGNHDSDKKIENYLSRPNTTLLGSSDYISYNKHIFYISHFPTETSNLNDIDKPLNRHILNLHGHTHASSKFYEDKYYTYNVGLDAHNMQLVPITKIFQDIVDKYNER